MKKPLETRELTVIAVFTAATAVFAQIAVPLPFSPVPISFGLVAVYMAGILLTPRQAVLSQLCYLLLGAVGAPVFGGFRGGPAALFGLTGGYLLVYPVMAGIVAYALNSPGALAAEAFGKKRGVLVRAALSVCLAHTVLYGGGTAWLSVLTGGTIVESLGIGVLPYIPLDAVKIVFCLTCVVPLRARFLSMLPTVRVREA